MEFNKIDLKLIEAYTVLLMEKKITLLEVPEKYRAAVEVKEAERIIEVLSQEGVD